MSIECRVLSMERGNQWSVSNCYLLEHCTCIFCRLQLLLLCYCFGAPSCTILKLRIKEIMYHFLSFLLCFFEKNSTQKLVNAEYRYRFGVKNENIYTECCSECTWDLIHIEYCIAFWYFWCVIITLYSIQKNTFMKRV